MVKAETLATQATKTAYGWLIDAKEAIDSVFGDGYVEKHPELVSGFMQAAALDQAGMYLRAIAESLENNQ
ncbi:hypothetical protein J0A78_02130 [Providencia rettgeri]|uniref:hypothetical protein n=1 Tax=Providencia rettgeri TaxID=587 RepID=UPI0019D4620C|nr:hypothetical protein [Providencia rettgeri]MBN7843662.1 hypothetical protein [Providencia rettgeri]MBN7852735.1 hypothetical protein [Providencia rettgeri]MBN7861532.1 hypothetical protein [Providencia rettgeri]MBN7871607.1 hypothetical protein [Providencia rettgeri]MBN7896839.1 hypothetical protein [Providencia rettgeri]